MPTQLFTNDKVHKLTDDFAFYGDALGKFTEQFGESDGRVVGNNDSFRPFPFGPFVGGDTRGER